MPCNRGNKCCLRPKDDVGISLQGLQAHAAQVVEVILVCGIPALPGIGAVLDGGDFPNFLGLLGPPVGDAGKAVHQCRQQYNCIGSQEEQMLLQVRCKTLRTASVFLEQNESQECLGQHHQESNPPDAGEFGNLDERKIFVGSRPQGSIGVSGKPILADIGVRYPDDALDDIPILLEQLLCCLQ